MSKPHIEASKIAFLNKFGSKQHKAGLSERVDKVLDSEDGRAIGSIARNGTLFKDEHVSRIVSSPGGIGSTHPVNDLIMNHPDKMKDEHWHRLAVTGRGPVISRNLSSMPVKHLKTAAEHHPSDYVRETAKEALKQAKQLGKK